MLSAALRLAVPLAALELLGIVASPDPALSVAILAEDGRTRLVALGEQAFGRRVVAIEPGRVVLEQAGERIVLRLRGSVVPIPAAAEPAAPPAPRPPPVLRLARAELDRRLPLEIGRILAETRVIPVRRGAAVVGLSLEQLPAGTLLSEIGLRPGDILTEINQIPLDSMATLAGLWPRLQGASQLTALVLRSGERVALDVRLEN